MSPSCRAWRVSDGGRGPRARAALLHAWGAALEAHRGDLAALMTGEMGKPRPEAEGEVAYAASFLHW